MVYIIIGFTGQGKSTLAYYIAKKSDTRVILDPRSQFASTHDIIPDCFELYTMLDERYEIIVQPGRGEELESNFNHCSKVVADWIEDNPQERICYLVDEGRLCGLDSKSVSPDFDWIIRSAREGSPIDVVITCHRPVDVSTNIRAIANRIILFRVMLPNDLGSIEEQCGEEVSLQVNKLLDKQYLLWNNSRQQWRTITDPATWYVKISEVPLVNETAS